MRKLQILKTFIDVFWFFSIIAIVGMLIFIPYMFVSNNINDLHLKINCEDFTLNTFSSKLLVTLFIISYFIFAYAVFLFRKLLSLFQKRIIFDDLVIELLNKIGNYFLISTIIAGISALIYHLIFKSKDIPIEFGGGFSSFLFASSLGLFFMVLSEVFKISKTMKDENELTI